MRRWIGGIKQTQAVGMAGDVRVVPGW